MLFFHCFLSRKNYNELKAVVTKCDYAEVSALFLDEQTIIECLRKENVTIKQLKLMDILQPGYFAEFIKENKCPTLTYFDISNNNLTSMGAIPIIDSLQKNHILTHVDLSENDMGDVSVSLLSNVLVTNRTLRFLNISNNGLTPLSYLSLAHVLKTNDVLETLIMNRVKPPEPNDKRYLMALEILFDHSHLKEIHIEQSGLDDTAGMVLAKIKNPQLRKINLNHNLFTDFTCILFIENPYKINVSLFNYKISRKLIEALRQGKTDQAHIVDV